MFARIVAGSTHRVRARRPARLPASSRRINAASGSKHTSVEAAAGRGQAEHEAEVGHAGEADERLVHARTLAATARRSTLQHAMEPAIVGEIGLGTRLHRRLKCCVFERPGRIGLHERNRSPPAGAARQVAGAQGEGRRPPLAQRLDVGVPLSARTSQVKWLRQESSVISSSIAAATPREAMTTWSGAGSRTGTPNDLELVAEVSEPERAGVEQVRAEVGQHAGALVAPGRIAHQPRGAVAVEHAASIRSLRARRSDELLHAHEVRLEAVVVGGIADDAVLSPPAPSSSSNAACLANKGFSTSTCLPIAEQIGQQLDLRLVRHADQRGVVAAERHVLDAPVSAPPD